MSGSAPPGYRASWAEIDLDRIASNFAALRALAGRQSLVLPVVKANAYGHGVTPIARRLEAEGVAGLCVGIPEEGLELRRAGITVPILCLGSVDAAQVAAAARSRITLTLYEPGQLAVFDQAGRAAGIPVHFHLKIETGMNRLGVHPGQVGSLLEALSGCRSAVLSGLYSNLAFADRPGDATTTSQAERLAAAADAIRAAGHDPRPVHLANSAAVLFHPALRLDAVRPGILLYGITPAQGAAAPGFAPVLSFKTTVLRVHSVEAGTTVGYGGSWKAARRSRLATLAVGYDDGLPRALSNKGAVLVGGQRAPLVGTISMDLSVADVTDCGPVEPGSIAVLIGSQGEETITAWELAEKAGTIPWDIVSGVGRRVPRVAFAGGEVVSVSDPLPPVKETAASTEPSSAVAASQEPLGRTTKTEPGTTIG